VQAMMSKLGLEFRMQSACLRLLHIVTEIFILREIHIIRMIPEEQRRDFPGHLQGCPKIYTADLVNVYLEKPNCLQSDESWLLAVDAKVSVFFEKLTLLIRTLKTKIVTAEMVLATAPSLPNEAACAKPGSKAFATKCNRLMRGQLLDRQITKLALRAFVGQMALIIDCQMSETARGSAVSGKD